MIRKSKLRIFVAGLGIFVVTVSTLFPFLWAIGSSLRPDDEIFKYANPLTWRTFIPETFTIRAYQDLFLQYGFLQPVLNTLIVAALGIITGCFVNSIAAFSIATFDFKGKNAIFMLLLFSFMVPFESIAIPLYRVVDQFHWVDTFLGIIVPGIADGLVLFLFVQFFKDLPSSLIEAARVDGATWKKIFISVIVPLSKPVFITAGLMIFMTHWNSYLWPLVISGAKDMRMVQVALSDFKQERIILWANLYAGSIVSALVPLVLFLPLQKYYVEGVTSGGVKG